MRFRVLFTAAALFALASFAFAQNCDLLVNYYQWPCPTDPPMTTGGCWTGTPIPDAAMVPVVIYDAAADTVLGVATLVNGEFYVTAGFFYDEYSLVLHVPVTVYAKVQYNYCTYTSIHYTLSSGPRTIETCQAEWTCVCETPQYQYDFGDLGVTHTPPLVSLECPNNGPAGVPYPNPFVTIADCHLGQGITAEAGPLVEDLDQFDDGVVFVAGTGPSSPVWDACMQQSVIVTLVGGGNMFLSAWKDGNMDGDFADVLCLTSPTPAPEWIIQDAPVECPGVDTFSFRDPGCPVNYPGYDGVFRFILCDHPVGSNGWQEVSCSAGEVEDYYILAGAGHQLPVELTAAPTVTAGDRELTLRFNVSDERDVTKYEIWRDGSNAHELTVGNGSYSYADKDLVNNRLYNYTIVAVSLNDRKELLFNGKTVWSGSPTFMAAVVTEYALYQNYPNPFNPSTEIVYDVLATGVVTLKVFNVMGQEVATLVNGTVNAGRNAATFNATGLTSGLYFYTITMGDFSATKKMLLVQ